MRFYLRDMPYYNCPMPDPSLTSGKKYWLKILTLPCIKRVSLDDDDESEDLGIGLLTDFQFIPTEWLHRFLDSPQATPVIETAPLLCYHGRLALERLNDVKVVDSEVADRLYHESGKGAGRKLIAHNALCRPCVRHFCKRHKLAKDSATDARVIATLLKEPIKE